MPLCYGCVRYSRDSQADGDSVRRQRDAILAWIKRQRGDVQLDTSLSFNTAPKDTPDVGGFFR